MLIKGRWYAEGSAAQFNAAFNSSHGHYRLETEHGLSYSGKLSDIKVSDRLGHVERSLTLADGSIFFTRNNLSVDALFKQHKSINRFIHAFESHWGLALLALAATVAFSFAFFRWGIPLVSSGIAQALPYKSQQFIGQGSLEFLDEYVFSESMLSGARQEEIREHFSARLIPLGQHNDEIHYRLHFREWSHGGRSIPNAFALPSGDIIVTDKFVELTRSQDEIDAVLLHEMGHIVNRHSLEMVIESAIVTTAVMLLSGDNSGLVDMGLGVGSLLASSNYSRIHESEADKFAFEQMLIVKIDPQGFSDIMRRMTEYIDSTTKNGTEVSRNRDDNFMDYLSSHPSTRKRSEQARHYSECFQHALTACDLVLK
ncbi:MAG: Zn-dependent protease with chaperone function [Motiliproteus sp.]